MIGFAVKCTAKYRNNIFSCDSGVLQTSGGSGKLPRLLPVSTGLRCKTMIVFQLNRELHELLSANGWRGKASSNDERDKATDGQTDRGTDGWRNESR